MQKQDSGPASATSLCIDKIGMRGIGFDIAFESNGDIEG